MSESFEEETVDWTVFCRARTELGAGFARILSYFREDGEKAVGRIEEAMRRRDMTGLVLPAHTLKSEARQFGAEPLGALAEEIEFAARRAIEKNPPPAPGGRRIKLRYITQVNTRPPSFVVFGNRLDEVPESYRRYLINGMRRELGFGAVPIRLALRGGRNPFDKGS